MGWFNDLWNKINPTKTKYAQTMNGSTPIFSQFGTSIYASDVVQQSIGCIATEMSKLRPEHDRQDGTDIVPVNSSLQAVLNNPNPRMTTSEFLEKITWLLFLNYNAFIIPTYYEKRDINGNISRTYDGLYPILPSQVDFIEDESNTLYTKFSFANGDCYTIPYSDVIHIKHRFSVNDFMGGNEAGQPDNGALLKTLELNHILLQGIAKAMKASYAVNAVVKYNTLMDKGETREAIDELQEKLRNCESGLFPLDLKAEYIPITKDTKLVDAETLKFIDEKILRNYGVSLPILTGDFTKEQYEAFYQKTIESLVIKYSQAFTKTLFTTGEKSHRNKVNFYPKDLIFMSVTQTLEMIRLLGDSGALYENEKRVMLGLKPLKELEGQRKQSLNYVDANIANKYQTGGTDNAEGSNQTGV